MNAPEPTTGPPLPDEEKGQSKTTQDVEQGQSIDEKTLREMARQQLEAHRISSIQEKTKQETNKTLIHSFDLASYEVLEKATYRELAPEDIDSIGELYTKNLMNEDVFSLYSEQAFSDAERMAKESGGMVHSWERNNEEESVAQELINKKKMSSHPPSCKQEFLDFLKKKHGRAANFRAWGMFAQEGKLIALCATFVPPRKTQRSTTKDKHAEQVRNFFMSRNANQTFTKSQKFNRQSLLPRAQTIAELYLIVGSVPGAATFCHAHMHQCLAESNMTEITDWYALRYGAFPKRVHPQEDTIRTASDATNKPSERFLGKRTFATCGEVKNHGEVVVRQHRNGVVGLELTWDVMHADHCETYETSMNEKKALEQKARSARNQQQAT